MRPADSVQYSTVQYPPKPAGTGTGTGTGNKHFRMSSERRSCSTWTTSDVFFGLATTTTRTVLTVPQYTTP